MTAPECYVKSHMWSNVKGKGFRWSPWTPILSTIRSLCSCLCPCSGFVTPVSCCDAHQHHDITHCHLLQRLGPFCEVSKYATAEVHCLLFPGALDNAPPSVSTLSTTESVIESFSLSPTFSAVPPEDLTPAPLPELFPIVTQFSLLIQ